MTVIPSPYRNGILLNNGEHVIIIIIIIIITSFIIQCIQK